MLNRANALFSAGQVRQAHDVYQQILAQEPTRFEALYQLGMIALQNASYQAAATLFYRASQSRPAEPLAHFYLAAALLEMAQSAPALEALDRATALKPDFSEAHYNRGIALIRLGRRQEALASFDQVLAIDPAHLSARTSKGTLLRDLGQHDAGLKILEQAFHSAPANPFVNFNLGTMLQGQGRIDEAIACFERVVQALPEHGPAHWGLAVCHLLSGRFESGWRLHEWRWRNEELELSRNKPNLRQPLWLGQEPIQGKTVLVHAEQGLGDTLQFCRYASVLASLGATVVLGVQQPLVPLMRSLQGPAQIVGNGEPLPAYDFHCPLMSLPLALWAHQPSIPSQRAYLQAAADKRAHWRAKLTESKRPRIGLAWSGRAKHSNDGNRSMALADLLPLVSDRFSFFVLQKEIRPADAATLASHAEIQDFSAELEDFSDTAALCASLDLVICVDTSIAHLAGALGVPVWILLPYEPDWRWQLQRSDSPWYPSARLFRQQTRGDWGPVIAQIEQGLLAHRVEP